MATAVAEPKNSRLDLRMTSDQKRQIERAARLNGVTVSQWSIAHLVASAREDILESSQIMLEESAFDEFLQLLQGDPTPGFDEFVEDSTRWER